MKLVTTPAEMSVIFASRRRQLKLSQASVAARVGLSQNRLSVLERDPAGLTTRQLLALLSALGLELQIAEPSTSIPQAEPADMRNDRQ